MQGRKGGRPDEGWSWVIAFAACFSSLVLAGIFRASGVLFVAFIDTFGATREEAAWPMGICIAVLNLTGPLSGILGQRYGVRPVVIAGAVIGAIGLSACYFTTSLTIIAVLFGGIFGFGFGLVNTLVPVIVNAYFLNLRGTANGIANSGSCVGSVILPVLFEYLIANFGLSGCFLLTGGVVLNVAVAGALMRPPPWKGPNNRWSSKDLVAESAVEEGSATLLTPRKASVTKVAVEVRKCSVEGFAPPDPGSEPHRNLQAELVSALSRRTMFHGGSEIAEVSYESLDTSNSSVFERKGSNLDFELLRAEKEFEDTLSDFQSVAADIVETSKSEEVLNRIESDGEVVTSQLTDNCPARHSFSVSSAKRRGGSRFKSQIPSSGPLKKYSFKLRNSSGDFDLDPVTESPDLGKNRFQDPFHTNRTTEGDVPTIRTTEGDVKAHRTTEGDVTADRSTRYFTADRTTEGDVKGKTTEGYITADGTTEHDVKVKTTEGYITADGTTEHDVKGKTTEGYITADGTTEGHVTAVRPTEGDVTAHRTTEDDVTAHRTTEDDVTADDTARRTLADPTDQKPSSVWGSFWTVLSSMMFYVTALTNVTFYFIFHMYVVIVMDYSLDQGVEEGDTKYVLFAFALSDLFGRLCLGWVTDRGILTRPGFVMSGMTGIGLVFFAFPFATDYYGLVVVSCCYGVLLGCTMIIFPILLVDYLGTEVHAVAYGCMCFMNGFTSFFRPLIIGYFRDTVGSYHNMFYILGSISLIASSLWLLERCFHHKRRPQSLYEPMKQRHQVT